jgi:hypothetical protein
VIGNGTKLFVALEQQKNIKAKKKQKTSTSDEPER